MEKTITICYYFDAVMAAAKIVPYFANKFKDIYIVHSKKAREIAFRTQEVTLYTINYEKGGSSKRIQAVNRDDAFVAAVFFIATIKKWPLDITLTEQEKEKRFIVCVSTLPLLACSYKEKADTQGSTQKFRSIRDLIFSGERIPEQKTEKDALSFGLRIVDKYLGAEVPEGLQIAPFNETPAQDAQVTIKVLNKRDRKKKMPQKKKVKGTMQETRFSKKIFEGLGNDTRYDHDD